MNIPTKCPLCRAAAPFKCARKHEEGEITYTLYGCHTCDAEFWWPLKNPGAIWYDHDVRYAGGNTEPVWAPHWYHKRILSYLAPFNGRVLDVGCGNGNFLVSAQKSGWKSYGIDISSTAVEAGKKWFGLDGLEVSDIVTYARTYVGEKFDLVTFFDVLEHVDNHNEFIESVRTLLKPGGYVAMSMPYRKHAQWLMPLDVPPRHLTRWDRTSLKRFLEGHGFSVVLITRHTDGLWPIILKLRFNFGRRLSFGAVNAVKRSLDNKPETQKKRLFLVRVTQLIAKIKDTCIFGLPAVLIWLFMLPSPYRYRTLYAIARKYEGL
jgi:SAM-dependent methyltransferase